MYDDGRIIFVEDVAGQGAGGAVGLQNAPKQPGEVVAQHEQEPRA